VTKPYPVVPFWIWFPAALGLPLLALLFFTKRIEFGSKSNDIESRIADLEK